MRYLVKERVEMLKDELLKLQNLKVKTAEHFRRIEIIDFVIKDYEATLKIHLKVLNDMIEKRLNLDKLQMQTLGSLVQEHISGLGYMLFVFPFQSGGISNYISNGQRDDMIKVLRETLERFEKNQIIDTPTNN